MPFRTVAALIGALAVLLTSSCVKATTFDGAAKPDNAELNRLQENINDRPDLDAVQGQLSQIDSAVRAAITRYAPQATLSVVPDTAPTADVPGLGACDDPFGYSIGRTFKSGEFPGGSVTDQQWKDITAALAPVFETAGFMSNGEPGPGDRNASQRRADDITIDLFGDSGTDRHLSYAYWIGCHLPTAWRTGPPPTIGYGLGPGSHYPYLYGDGRVDDTYPPSKTTSSGPHLP